MPERAHRPLHAQSCALVALGRLSRIDLITAVVLVLAGLIYLAARAYAPAPVAGGHHDAAAEHGNNVAAPAQQLVGALLPPLVPVPEQARRSFAGSPASAPASSLAADGIPTTALSAYQNAAGVEAVRDRACGISWALLAAIGRVESDHGRFAGAVLHTDGRSTPRIIGIALDGNGTALIRDTDSGRLDGDTTYDRAVGPMQFIPSTWAVWGVDADGDGVANPFDIFDAAVAAANYLCAAGGDLTTTTGQRRAVLAYNHSDAYVAEVLALEAAYQQGVADRTVAIVPADPSAARDGEPTAAAQQVPRSPYHSPGTGEASGTASFASPDGSASPSPSKSPAVHLALSIQPPPDRSQVFVQPVNAEQLDG